MSEKIYHVRCCGCNCRIDVDGYVLRGSKNGNFDNMRQVREVAKNHNWFCANYTGEFHVTANWYVEVSA